MKQLKYILSLFCFTFLISCNSEKSDTADSEQAYKDYRAFVAEVEGDTVINENDLGAPWTARTDTLRANFERHRSGITDHLDNYKAEQREEVNAFEERVEAAFEERQRKYDEVSYRYKLRQEMLGITVSEDDLSSINASNIVGTYEHFINTLKRDLDNYTARDWDLIEGWWNALENRRQSISKELKASEKESIASFQQTFRQLRDQALGPDAPAE